MNLVKTSLSLFALLWLAACGGGGGSSGTPIVGGGGPGGGGAQASELVMVLSAPTIANNGSQTVTATVTALDDKRNALAGVRVAIAVDSNAIVLPSGTETDDKGVVTGDISIGSDRTNRTITVTATSGSLTRTATLLVRDAAGGTPTAADLSLVLAASSLANSGTSTVLATATAVDSNRNAVAGIPVTIGVDSSAVATVSGAVTNASGVVTANIGIGADRTNRVVTVTATSGTLTRTASFRVVGADLTASLVPLVDAGSQNNQIEYRLVDTNALAMVGQSISITAPGLPSATGTTDINGKFVYTYAAPAAAGSLTITATAAGDTELSTVTVQAPGGTVPPASAVPQSASVTPSPSVVSVNTPGSTVNQVELRALFLGANNAPISRVRVRFDLDGNVNNSDGRISPGGAGFAYSDSNGVARSAFIPGQRSSPTNGVTIRACYDVADFPVGACPNAARATLTVASEALSVNIRTNELIKSGRNSLTYIKEYVVMVVDAAGQAKPDVLITPSVDLPSFQKGFWVFSQAVNRWVRQPTLADTEYWAWNPANRSWGRVAPTSGPPACPNDDVNRNAVREAGNLVPGAAAPDVSAREEDLNWNGDLDPRKADVAVTMVGSPRTDQNGLAVLQIEYGKNLASWVDFVITVTASGVAGTEARATFQGLEGGLGNLPFEATAITNRDVAPPFVFSPYGRSAVCTDAN
jgi:hypothetical protein